MALSWLGPLFVGVGAQSDAKGERAPSASIEGQLPSPEGGSFSCYDRFEVNFLDWRALDTLSRYSGSGRSSALLFVTFPYPRRLRLIST